MTKQDVIDLLRIHATINPKDKEVIEAVIEFIDLKFNEGKDAKNES
jgi:hypothetical protein